MNGNFRANYARSVFASFIVLACAAASSAQQRYQPSTPTVSPYLNLFQNNRGNGPLNRALPNYYSLVRPQLDQNQFNRAQLQVQQQQNQSIQQLQAGVGFLAQQQTGQAITGHNSWFRNTSQYYSRGGASRPVMPRQASTSFARSR
jgi:hypothetical protein